MIFHIDESGSTGNSVEFSLVAFLRDDMNDAVRYLGKHGTIIRLVENTYECDGVTIIDYQRVMRTFDDDVPNDAKIMLVASWGYRWDDSPNNYKVLEVCDGLARILATEPDYLISCYINQTVD